MKTNTTSLTKASAFLAESLKQERWKNGEKLPTCKELAQMAGVGHMTMWQALQVAKENKLVCINKRVGIFAGQVLPKKLQEQLPTKKLIWEQVREKLEQDIFEGAFHGLEVLPKPKELMTLYRVDHRTLKKALAALVADKIIVRDKHNLKVVGANHTSNQKLIYFIMSEMFYDTALYNREKNFFYEFLLSLEKECVLKGIRLVKCAFTSTLTINDSPGKILGFIVWHSQDLNLLTHKLVFDLQRQKKPVAVCIYAQSGPDVISSLVDWLKKNTGFFISSCNYDRHAGAAIGRLLIAKGHKKAAFLSTSINVHWSHERLAGLRETFEKFGMSNAVVPLVRLNASDMYPPGSELEFLANVREQAKEKVSPPFDKMLEISIDEITFARNLLDYNKDVFQQAFALNDCNAWVCTDDNFACYGALEFLKCQNIPASRKIGVVGFDDNIESKTHNLTTYHFDYMGAARKMVAMIAYPEYAKKTYCTRGTNMFEIDGMVIDRGSA